MHTLTSPLHTHTLLHASHNMRSPNINLWLHFLHCITGDANLIMLQVGDSYKAYKPAICHFSALLLTCCKIIFLKREVIQIVFCNISVCCSNSSFSSNRYMNVCVTYTVAQSLLLVYVDFLACLNYIFVSFDTCKTITEKYIIKCYVYKCLL